MTAHQITIAWNASPAPVDGYNVYRGTAHGNETAPPLNGATLVTGLTFTDDAVFPGQVYSYMVRSVFMGQESAAGIDILSPAVPFPPSPSHLDLGAATSFGILAGSTITNVPGNATHVSGDVGVSPGTSITGMDAPSYISGIFHRNDFVSASAESSLGVAIAAAQALTGAVTIPADIGGSTILPGLYSVASSLAITGNVVLDARGDPNAVWIFLIGSTLTTAASNSGVILVGGAEAANVFWIVGSSATLGINTAFAGNILAQVSITVNTSASVNGRLLARTGAVTLDGNGVVVFQACELNPLPASPPNVPPARPIAPMNTRITSES
jgi:hypothetical protein